MHMHVYIHTYEPHTYTHAQILTYTHVYIHTYIYINKHVHIHTYTHSELEKQIEELNINTEKITINSCDKEEELQQLRHMLVQKDEFIRRKEHQMLEMERHNSESVHVFVCNDM